MYFNVFFIHGNCHTPPPSLYLKIKMSNANIALMNISLVIE